MNDKELLELAAKAAGINVKWVRNSGCFYYDDDETGHEEFDPLSRDGQALRLAVKLQLDMWIGDGGTEVECGKRRKPVTQIANNGDPCAATRRAIVRAAAEIGKEMK